MEYRYWTNTNTAQLPHRSARLSSLIFEAALVAAGGVAGAKGLGELDNGIHMRNMQCHTNQWGVANELEDRIMPKSVASATDALQKRG